MKNTWLIVTAVVLGVAFVIFFALFVNRDSQLEKQIEVNNTIVAQLYEKEQLLKKQYNMDSCIEQAYKDYTDSWNGFCKLNNYKMRRGTCNLPLIVSNEFDKAYQQEKSLCITRYK